LLDQRRVVAGVGNWVADEVLYQTRIHPDQNYLTTEQATLLLERLHSILATAVDCLVEKNSEFPSDWLFHYRWNSKKTTNDAHGRVVTFVTSGGRTSAIVPSLQQKKGQSKSKDPAVHTQRTKKKRLTVTTDAPVDDITPSTTPSSNTKKRKIRAVKEENEKEVKVVAKEATRKKAKAVKVEKSSAVVHVRRRSSRLSS
jgi:formamidopyrimidine-DNA glycosylase